MLTFRRAASYSGRGPALLIFTIMPSTICSGLCKRTGCLKEGPKECPDAVPGVNKVTSQPVCTGITESEAILSRAVVSPAAHS